MTNQEKAARAERLQADEVFQDLMKNVRDDAVTQFLSSGPEDQAVREDAHALVRAIDRIEGRLQGDIDSFTIEQKKDRHRGSD